MDAPKELNQTIAPGEGERRAMRGYVPQYELGARLIYEAILSGNLQWIGLADRSAGHFDDIVLGLRNGISAYQLKTKFDPEAFSLRTLLLGAEGLLGKMIASRNALLTAHPAISVTVIFATDDIPRTTDNILAADNSKVSSAAYIRAHNAHASSWSLKDWSASEFPPATSAWLGRQEAENLHCYSQGLSRPRAPSSCDIWRSCLMKDMA